MPNKKAGDYQKTADYLEKIIALMPGHVYWKNREGILQGCNDEQARSIGLSSRLNIVGLTAYDTLPKDFANEVTRVDKEVMETGIARTVEEVLTLPNGEKSIWLSKKVPLFDAEGTIIGVLGISFDITEQRKTEQELQETRHKLEGMTIVSASIAHELRTPLATIGIGAGSFGRYIPPLIDTYQIASAANLAVPKLDLQSLEQLSAVSQSLVTEANTGNLFIDMLLQNIRPTLDGTPIQTFSVSTCIEEALARYPFIDEQKELVIWNKAHDFMVRGKEDKLIVHVLFNLLKNALFYVADAGKGNIQLWLEPGKPYNKLIFKDTGKGIASDIVPHIFDRFFSKTHNGAGVGLTFCKMVMENLSGSITCESELGNYTQFILSFPNID
jgi:PAS domain S-box-containing protein